MHKQAEKTMKEPVCDKNDIVKDECSVSLALKILGKKWTFLILCELLLNHKLYFSQLQKSIIGPDGENISARVLSECLSRLELDHGIILRTVHSDEMPIRVSYSLTEKGEDYEFQPHDKINLWACHPAHCRIGIVCLRPARRSPHLPSSAANYHPCLVCGYRWGRQQSV